MVVSASLRWLTSPSAAPLLFLQARCQLGFWRAGQDRFKYFYFFNRGRPCGSTWSNEGRPIAFIWTTHLDRSIGDTRPFDHAYSGNWVRLFVRAGVAPSCSIGLTCGLPAWLLVWSMCRCVCHVTCGDLSNCWLGVHMACFFFFANRPLIFELFFK